MNDATTEGRRRGVCIDSTTLHATLTRTAGLALAALAIAAAGCTSNGDPAQRLGTDFETAGESFADDGLPMRVLHVPTGITMVYIAPGRFTMGSPREQAGRDGDEREHEVVISDPFYLGETEVTVEQWRRAVAGHPEETEVVPAHDDHPNLPMTSLGWRRSVRLAEILNEGGGARWRLPSEVEWEYACRAGTTSVFSFGDTLTAADANFDAKQPYAGATPGERSAGPEPVRSYAPNAWGLYEMHGNVWEWCEDRYVMHPGTESPPKTSTDAGAPRIIRGGAWTSQGKRLRSAHRDGYPPSANDAKYGVRLALTIPPG